MAAFAHNSVVEFVGGARGDAVGAVADVLASGAFVRAGAGTRRAAFFVAALADIGARLIDPAKVGNVDNCLTYVKCGVRLKLLIKFSG